VLIAASGFSLEQCIPFIRDHRKDFFLVAVSSALETLTANGITSDLCITTDGGFWAKELLQHGIFTAMDGSVGTPIACSAESAVPSSLFENREILPLTYHEKSAEKIILEALGIQTVPVLRNGTVSGTALSLAFSLTRGQVFFCGLDLESGKGYQHAQPNARELRERANDTRLSPLAARQALSGINAGGSLSLYRKWFQSAGLQNRVFRISSVPYKTSIGLQDILSKDYELLRGIPRGEKPGITKNTDQAVKTGEPRERIQSLNALIAADIERAKTGQEPRVFTMREIFPARVIMLSRSGKHDKKKLHDDYIERLESLAVFVNRLQSAARGANGAT
jgi:hypothetical protein